MNKNIKSSYKRYLETTDNPVDVKDYVKINNLYNQFMTGKAMQGHEITLPARMGILSVVGRKQKVRMIDGKVVGLAPDWVKTKQLWDSNPEAKAAKKLMYHTNLHTDGIRYKWNWSKNGVLVENKTLYALRMTRTNKRDVRELINRGNQFITK